MDNLSLGSLDEDSRKPTKPNKTHQAKGKRANKQKSTNQPPTDGSKDAKDDSKDADEDCKDSTNDGREELDFTKDLESIGETEEVQCVPKSLLNWVSMF